MPESYDFNETYKPLVVYNQADEGSCFNHALGLCVAAHVLMHTDVQPWWINDGISYPQLEQVGYVNGVYVDYALHFKDNVRHQAIMEEANTNMSPSFLAALLDTAGVMILGININASFANPPQTPGLPIIAPIAADKPVVRGHEVLAVGYNSKGIVIQNSYGLSWGYKGRAILSWAWLAANNCQSQRVQTDDYPLNGATKPPQPLKDDMAILLAQRTPASPVFAFLGGARTWIWSRTVLPAQGLSMADVKVIDGSDPVWTVPIIGKQPPADN
ncbi:MAG: hypothetical protein JWO15_3663 [Sphingomonadales bacterium]|nr:hypothetical protein [Sphingomonadales bacterium]